MITSENIENFRGGLGLDSGDLPYEMWDVFDVFAYDLLNHKKIVCIKDLISSKNQLCDPKFVAGLKPDPRQTAFEFMKQAAIGRIPKREPLTVMKKEDGCYVIIDGNATAQVLMLVKWNQVPVKIISTDVPSENRH